MNKKFLAILLMGAMLLPMAGCAKAPVAKDPMDLTGSETKTATVSELSAAYFTNMPDHSYKIDNKEFVKKVVDGEAMTVLDIRTAEDYAKGHIKGAVNLPWGPAIAENLSKIPTDKPIYIYCYTGQTAGQAVMTMNVAGIEARSVHFGWNLGISKVDGFEAVTVTEAATLSGTGKEINAAVQTAVTDYYAGLGKITDAKFKNYKISEDDLKALVDAKDSSIYILSVRKAEDYLKGHIEGANNIPFGKGMEASFATLPKDKKIVVYCYSGQTSGQTTAALRLMGYDAVSLNAGMGIAGNAPAGWMNKGFPVVSEVSTKAEALYTAMPDHRYIINQVDFVAKVAAKEAMTVLDIRTAEDYAKGHVTGSVNVPWGPAIAENLSKIPTDKPVYIYCYTGQTAGQAVTTMNLAGIDAKSVNLGWNFGISKAEGAAAVTSMDAATLTGTGSKISEAIQSAVTAYYEGLGKIEDPRFKNYNITEDDLKALVDAKDTSIHILSIRKAEDFAIAHIEGATNIPIGKEMVASFKTLPKDKKIVFY
ncbi:MAG TPA: rhodanese-like domain-containing protein, partial [Clostridiaceae bacterium]|nr:rhodanese-like domain-containing protein [Clostridiaceae bacterium]